MWRNILVLTIIFPALSACSFLLPETYSGGSRQGTSSSLVDFLYPGGEVPPPADGSLPILNLPAAVGIVFVPSKGHETLSAVEKTDLLGRVGLAFEDRKFVKSITSIPDAYLRSVNGIQGMRQVARMFNVDVIALVSYDQLSISAHRDSSLLYWTVVGALLVKGSNNEVQTLIDTAVFDVQSGELLFRAPGIYKDSRNATMVDQSTDLRALRVDGFSKATDDMIVNLDEELAGLQEAVKEGRRAKVAWSGGGGCTDTALLLMLASAIYFTRRRNACRR